MSMRRSFIFGVFGALWLAVAASGATVKTGTLATSAGNPITDTQLASWIDEFIPAASNRLIVLTECYGGDKVDNFAGKTNTAVISATSPGQTAKYGGYDNDAGAALAPGAGTTGATVHTAGTNGKHASETPTTGGGLAPGAFDLQPTNPTGAVQSRHVLVYAGQPDGGGGTSDVQQRDTIKTNFAGQANTTVTSVGGGGGGGWDKPGSAKGLRDALKEIGDAITSSPNPDKEQFILFVTDHGDLHKTETATVTAPASSAVTVPGLESFQTSIDLEPSDLFFEQNNITSFSFFIDFLDNGLTASEGSGPFFNPGDWELTLDNGSQTFQFNNFFEQFTELTTDPSPGIIGDQPGEGVRLYFPVPETLFVDQFFDVFVDVTMINATSQSYLVSGVSQDTGAMSKAIPLPTAALAGLSLLAGMCAIRRLEVQVRYHRN